MEIRCFFFLFFFVVCSFWVKPNNQQTDTQKNTGENITSLVWVITDRGRN